MGSGVNPSLWFLSSIRKNGQDLETAKQKLLQEKLKV
jgi:hypothetical protein